MDMDNISNAKVSRPFLLLNSLEIANKSPALPNQRKLLTRFCPSSSAARGGWCEIKVFPFAGGTEFGLYTLYATTVNGWVKSPGAIEFGAPSLMVTTTREFRWLAAGTFDTRRERRRLGWKRQRNLCAFLSRPVVHFSVVHAFQRLL